MDYACPTLHKGDCDEHFHFTRGETEARGGAMFYRTIQLTVTEAGCEPQCTRTLCPFHSLGLSLPFCPMGGPDSSELPWWRGTSLTISGGGRTGGRSPSRPSWPALVPSDWPHPRPKEKLSQTVSGSAPGNHFTGTPPARLLSEGVQGDKGARNGLCPSPGTLQCPLWASPCARSIRRRQRNGLCPRGLPHLPDEMGLILLKY